MKRNQIFCLFVVLAAVLGGPVAQADDFETIEASLRGRAVVMELPDGVRRVRVRVRQPDGSWQLCTIAHLAGTERYLKLRLPDGAGEDDIEIAASYSDPFPHSHYLGQSAFGTTTADGSAVAGPMSPDRFGDAAADPTEEAAVEESDIWKWRGRTLYFFNQYRGLQVIDVSDPAAPERLASHRLPSSGEQMYLHPSADLVVLLTYDSGTGNGEVVLVRHPSRHELHERESFPVPGYILESRMVGTILYVVSRHSFEERLVDPDTGAEHVTWRSGLAITKIDLGDPDHPVAHPPVPLASESYNYWGAQVQATSQALLISTNAYDAARRQTISTVHVVDISDPDVPPAVTRRLPVAGQVLDKFNMRLDGGVLTVVSQVWRGSTIRQRYASVETFDLAGSPGGGESRLGHLEFAQNESITATRFVGDLCYVVTFLRIDPLFVVSLADPARPELLGELEIPGFSTHLEPFGADALISVGVEGSQIAVSWFDVSDPAAPALVSRVHVGPPDGWSWTEANWDEKAFGFFPDDGLILLPYQGSDPVNGRFTGVQVIELGDGELIKRGSYGHEFQARRARVLDDAVASISGRALRTLDLSDPDDPQFLAELILAWPADLVHRVGDSLVQLERGGGYWYHQTSATSPPGRLHVSPVSDPDVLTTSLDLGPGRVVGSFLRGDCLWVAQLLAGTINDGTVGRYAETFAVTAIDLADPHQPLIAGRDAMTTSPDEFGFGAGADYLGELLPDGSLVWYPGEQNHYFYMDYMDPLAGRVAGDGFMPYYPRAGRVYTVAIADKTAPEVLVVVDLRETDRHWPEGAYRLVGPVLYYGLQNTGEVIRPDGILEWRAHHWLGQVDLTDPAGPVKRDLVRLPGTFEHAQETPAGGTVLFTGTRQSIQEADVWRSELLVQALAFDGIAAYRIDELVVPDDGYGPMVFDGSFMVLGSTDYASGEAVSTLAIYQWLSSGQFGALQKLRRPGALYRLAVSDQLLLAGESNGLAFIDFANPADPDPAVVSFANAFIWQPLGAIDIYQREFAYVPLGFQGVSALDFGGAFPLVGPAPMDGGEPSDSPEWTLVDLRILPVTGAVDGLLIGGLTEDESWLAAESVVQLSYDEWTRAALGLAPDDPVPPADDDTDSDRLTNGWEFRTGSDPGDPTSFAGLRPFVADEGNGGDRYFQARLFVNPHAPAIMLPEASLDAIYWIPIPGFVQSTPDPFSSSVVLRFMFPVHVLPNGFLRVSFSDP
jgi:uncharacterized secreted protein with C-terminal beta-propeller domain